MHNVHVNAQSFRMDCHKAAAKRQKLIASLLATSSDSRQLFDRNSDDEAEHQMRPVGTNPIRVAKKSRRDILGMPTREPIGEIIRDGVEDEIDPEDVQMNATVNGRSSVTRRFGSHRFVFGDSSWALIVAMHRENAAVVDTERIQAVAPQFCTTKFDLKHALSSMSKANMIQQDCDGRSYLLFGIGLTASKAMSEQHAALSNAAARGSAAINTSIDTMTSAASSSQARASKGGSTYSTSGTSSGPMRGSAPPSSSSSASARAGVAYAPSPLQPASWASRAGHRSSAGSGGPGLRPAPAQKTEVIDLLDDDDDDDDDADDGYAVATLPSPKRARHGGPAPLSASSGPSPANTAAAPFGAVRDRNRGGAAAQSPVEFEILDDSDDDEEDEDGDDDARGFSGENQRHAAASAGSGTERLARVLQDSDVCIISDSEDEGGAHRKAAKGRPAGMLSAGVAAASNSAVARGSPSSGTSGAKRQRDTSNAAVASSSLGFPAGLPGAQPRTPRAGNLSDETGAWRPSLGVWYGRESTSSTAFSSALDANARKRPFYSWPFGHAPQPAGLDDPVRGLLVKGIRRQYRLRSGSSSSSTLTAFPLVAPSHAPVPGVRVWLAVATNEKPETKGAIRAAVESARAGSGGGAIGYCEENLPIGDFLWLGEVPAGGVSVPHGGSSSSSSSSSSGGASAVLAAPGSRCVLGYICERKRVDDLVSSITASRTDSKGTQQRYGRQKHELLRCGLTRLQYLVEGDPNSLQQQFDRFHSPHKTIRTASCETLMDGMTLITCESLLHTASKLATLTRLVQQEAARRTDWAFAAHRFEAWAVHVRAVQQEWDCTLPVWAGMLLQYPSMRQKYVEAVVSELPTPAALVRAFRAAGSDEAREKLLRSLPRARAPGAGAAASGGAGAIPRHGPMGGAMDTPSEAAATAFRQGLWDLPSLR